MATIKDLLSAMISKINKAPKTVNGVEPDENGNITSSWNDLPDRPFGDIVKTLVDNVTVECVEMGEGLYGATNPFVITLVEGNTYKVSYDGVEYECVATYFNSAEMYYIGNGALAGIGTNSDEPFICAVTPTATMFATTTEGKHSVTIIGEALVPIDARYLPTLDVNLTKDGDAYTADKTLGEINEAVRKGENVRLLTLSDDGIPLTYCPLGSGPSPTFVSFHQGEQDVWCSISVFAYRHDDKKWVAKSYSLRND